MTTQITIPREVVEQALYMLDIAQSLCGSWKSLHHPNMLATYNKLRAALTEQVQPTIRDAFGLAALAQYDANQAEAYRKVVLAISNAVPGGHEVNLDGLVQLVTALAQTKQDGLAAAIRSGK